MTKFGRKSDHPAIQIWPSGNFLSRNAPFGTLDTPSTTVKIIGSKYVPVLETKGRNSQLKGYRSSRRLLALNPISDKPTQINPVLLQAMTTTSEDSQSLGSPNLVRKTPLGFRPDSKTAKLTPYSALPPIARYRTKNQMSTVFEPECWTLPRRDFMRGRDHGGSGYLGKSEDSDLVRGRNRGRDDHIQQQQQQQQQQHSPDIQHETYVQTDAETDQYNLLPTTATTTGPFANTTTTTGSSSSATNPPMTTTKNANTSALFPHPNNNAITNTTKDGPGLHVLRAAEADHPVSDRHHLLSLLPKRPYLPSEPLRLTAGAEIKLMRLIHHELTTPTLVNATAVHSNVLREVYMMLSTFDRRLTGWCRLQDITFSMAKKKVPVSTEILRLVASLFVSSEYPGLVNYEKILSLFGAALKFGHNNNVVKNQVERHSILRELQQPEDCQPKYFNNTQERPPDLPKVDSPSPDRDIAIAKLIRAVERELLEVKCNIDFDKLTSSFQTEDRNHRETLSADQIKLVCYRNAIPVRESLLDDILHRCCDVSNGQYSWHKFISFLERVQPIHTGLRIPSSKRPLEYAKNYLAPLPSWPKASQSPRDISQMVLSSREQHFKAAGLSYNQQQQSNKQRLERDNTDKHTTQRDSNNNNYRLGQKELEQTAMVLSHPYSHKSTEPRGNEKPQSNTRVLDDGTWFDRYMKMANKLYAQDTEHAGYLPLKDVWSVVHTYNSKYNLSLPELRIERAIAESLDQGHVYLHSMLKNLGGIAS